MHVSSATSPKQLRHPESDVQKCCFDFAWLDKSDLLHSRSSLTEASLRDKGTIYVIAIPAPLHSWFCHQPPCTRTCTRIRTHACTHVRMRSTATLRMMRHGTGDTDINKQKTVTPISFLRHDAATIQIDDRIVSAKINCIGDAHLMQAAQVGKADLNCKTNIAQCVQKGFPIQAKGPMPASCAFDS